MRLGNLRFMYVISVFMLVPERDADMMDAVLVRMTLEPTKV